MKLSPASDPKLREQFQRYREMFPHEYEDRCWVAVAEYFDLQNDEKRTISAFKQAILLNPEWGKWHLDLAKAYMRAKKLPEAIHHLERCAELSSSGCQNAYFAENVLYYLGYALFMLKRYKEAAEAWRGAETTITSWRHPEPLKDFHLHRGWAYHLERQLLDALEAYRRGMVAPGPGDCSEDDPMDPDEVESVQDAMNDNIMKFHQMAKEGEIPDADTLKATPYTS